MKQVLAVLCAGALVCGGGGLLAQPVYKSVGPDGRVIYTDKPPEEGAQPAELPPLTTVPATKPPAKPQGAAKPAPAQDPEARRRELQAWLAREQRSLEEARKTLAEQEGMRLGDERHNYQRYLDRVQPYRDAVANKERLVQQLTEQLAGIK